MRKLTKIEALVVAMFQTARSIHDENPELIDEIDTAMLDMIMIILETSISYRNEISQGSKLVN